MQFSKMFFAVLLLLIAVSASAQTGKLVDHFTKVIVSPYIQVTFVEGNEESVTLNNITVDTGKLHLEVNNKILRLYLDGAKDIPKNKKDYTNGYKEQHPLYNGTVVNATVTYKTLNELSLRGEETQLCKSPITGDKFILNIYGESKVIFNELNLQQLYTIIYGESSLEIKSGSVKAQKYTCYGESTINTLAITGSTSHISAYGESDFKINVSDKIRITAYGDARLHYKGNPEISKGLHFGDMIIDKVD